MEIQKIEWNTVFLMPLLVMHTNAHDKIYFVVSICCTILTCRTGVFFFIWIIYFLTNCSNPFKEQLNSIGNLNCFIQHSKSFTPGIRLLSIGIRMQLMKQLHGNSSKNACEFWLWVCHIHKKQEAKSIKFMTKSVTIWRTTIYIFIYVKLKYGKRFLKLKSILLDVYFDVYFAWWSFVYLYVDLQILTNQNHLYIHQDILSEKFVRDEGKLLEISSISQWRYQIYLIWYFLIFIKWIFQFSCIYRLRYKTIDGRCKKIEI